MLLESPLKRLDGVVDGDDSSAEKGVIGIVRGRCKYKSYDIELTSDVGEDEFHGDREAGIKPATQVPFGVGPMQQERGGTRSESAR